MPSYIQQGQIVVHGDTVSLGAGKHDCADPENSVMMVLKIFFFHQHISLRAVILEKQLDPRGSIAS